MQFLVILVLVVQLGFSSQKDDQWPFEGQLGQKTYLTSSYAESRGSRYHTGWDYSTLNQEGIEIKAPEDGAIIRIKVSPWGYGKAIYFKGSSGKIYVLAHLSGFVRGNRVLKELQRQKTNTLDWKGLNWRFKKGQALAYTGASGIGSPHLHLEVRPNISSTELLSKQATHRDTIAPILTAIAIMELNPQIYLVLPITNLADSGDLMVEQKRYNQSLLKKKQTEISVKTASDSHLSKSQGIALRLVDYSVNHGENPMSIASLSIECDHKLYYKKEYDQLSFGKHPIHQDLLWSRDDQLAGDWHWIPHQAGINPWIKRSGITQCLTQSELLITLADANGNQSQYQVKSAHKNGVSPLRDHQIHQYFKGNQPGAYFSHLKNFYPNHLYMDEVQTSTLIQISKNSGMYQGILGHHKFKLSPQALKSSSIYLGLRDSLTYEWHPKGTFTRKKKSEYCYPQPPGSGWALYYQAESSLQWVFYSGQKSKTIPTMGKDVRHLCIQLNELRDTRIMQDTLAPLLSDARLQYFHRDGRQGEFITLDIKDLASMSSSNQINAYLVDKQIEEEVIDMRLRTEGQAKLRTAKDYRWTALEWDPEKSHIVIRGVLPQDKILAEMDLWIVAEDDLRNIATLKIDPSILK